MPVKLDYERIVGGQLLPTDVLQVVIYNLWWIFIVAAPIAIYFLMTKYNTRIPGPVARALRMITGDFIR